MLDTPKYCDYTTLDLETAHSGYVKQGYGNGPEIDIIYDGCEPGAGLTLERTGGRALGYSSEAQNSYDQCKQDALSNALGRPEPISNIQPGNVLCVITNAYGVARIKIISVRAPYAPDSPKPTLDLSVTYWPNI